MQKNEKAPPSAKAQDASQKALGARVRSHRERLGLTKHQLAIQAGLAPESISGIERGDTDPRASTMRKIADVLGVPAGFLTFG